MNWNKTLVVALLGTAAALPAARATEPPDALVLLDAALGAPSIPYQGRVIVTQWFGRQTSAEEMIVHVSPPDRVRRDFLAPDGSPRRISVSDGETENVRLVRSGKTVVGNAVRSDQKVLPPQIEREALLANYELASSTGEKVAGRPTWKLALKPKAPGKSWQTLWVDQETNVILRSKRFLPRRSFASQAQFLVFEPRKPQPDALFQLDESTQAVIQARGLAPEFLTLEQLNQATGEKTRLPERLPGGFVFESADVFPVGRGKVRHARYTDGLTVLSLFQTDHPVRLPKGGPLPSGDARLAGPLRASRAGNLMQWSSGRRHYTLMGDVSHELLTEISKSLR